MSGSSLFTHHASTLRAVIEACGALPTAELMKQPGVSGVYRVIIFRHDARLRDSVTTLILHHARPPHLECAYAGALAGKALRCAMLPARCDAFVRTLQQIQFDHLSDQPDLPGYSSDLWLIERAAGQFRKDVILAPAVAVGVHHTLAAAVRTYLPEALREIE
jgi:hypothetical protein